MARFTNPGGESSGIPGPQGAPGAQGTTGIQGLTGTQGAEGLQGISGSQGIAGSQGTSGIQGLIGPQGDPGIISGTTSVLSHEVKAGEALTKGQAVYVSNADGTNMIVSKASNATEATSSKTIGLVTTDLQHNDQGFVITEGLLDGLNTSTATAGDPVWLGTNGNLIYGLTNKPVAPAHLVFIGIVTRSNINNGEIFVKPQNGFELREIHDVLLEPYVSTADNELLSFDSASGLWKNQTASEAGFATVSTTGSYSDLINKPAVYSRTLFVDPNGNDTTGDGGANFPFKTIQKAHDYANTNISLNDQVVVRINCGTYSENLSVTRPNIHFIGPSEGVTKSTRISGTVNVNTSSSIGGTVNDMVSFENILIAAGPGAGDVLTAAGSYGYALTLNNVYIFTQSTSAKCINITNTVSGGLKIEMKNVILQNQSSSGNTLELSNVYYANIDRTTFFNGSGKALNITSSGATITSSRFESSGPGATTMIGTNSSFTPGAPTLTLGNSWIVNPMANGNGIEMANGSIASVATVAFNVGAAAGTGFAVKGVAGATFVNGNNLFVAGTNSKISTAITRVPLVTSLTPA
jgi:hypothetical protein